MPIYANSKNKDTIKSELSETVNGFFKFNKFKMDPEMQTWIDKVSANNQKSSLDTVLDEIEKFDFVDEKNSNYQAQSEMKDLFSDLRESLVQNSSGNTEFDYEAWKNNVVPKFNEITEKLDNFNEATDYTFVNSQKMRALKTFLNKIETVNATVENCIYDEKIDLYEKTTRNLEERLTERENNSKAFLAFCQENSLHYDRLGGDQYTVNNAQNLMKNVIDGEQLEIEYLQRKVDRVENRRSFSVASLELTNAMLENRVLQDASKELSENHNPADYDNAIKQSEAKIKEKTLNLIEINKQTEITRDINDFIKQKAAEVRDLNPDEAKMQLTKVSAALKEPSRETVQLDAYKNVQELQKKSCEYAKENYDSLKPFAEKINEAGNLGQQYESANLSVHSLSQTLGNAKNSIVPQEHMKNTFVKDLDRFINQSEKCRRWGHRDSAEFVAMQKALKDAKENMSVDNIKKLKSVADDYLAKKGAGNTFNTKMRQHRKDLAKAISDFADKCAEFDNTLEKANAAVQKADNVIPEAQKDVIESLKGNYKVEKDNPVNEKINAFYAIRDEYSTKKDEADAMTPAKTDPAKRKAKTREEVMYGRRRKEAPKIQQPERGAGY